MRTITFFKDSDKYRDGEVVVFRVRKTSVEGRDKIIMEETT
jgi:hypothetical protein